MSGSLAPLPSPRVLWTFVLALAAAAILAPITTYAVSLALFGVPHVVTELRYVDRRFGARFSPQALVVVGSALLLLVVVRTAQLFGGVGAPASSLVQAVLLAALAALLLPALFRVGGVRAWIGGVAFSAVLFGAWTAPLATLVVFAFLHNLSPVGFLAERFVGAERRRVLRGCGLVFAVAPLVVASLGALLLTLSSGSIGRFDLAARFAGSFEVHRSAFVPSFVTGEGIGRSLFQAAAFLQCMHHAVVLRVLPHLAPVETRTLLPWPSAPVFHRISWVLASAFAIAFLLAFSSTRAIYGVLAAVHAWVEVPVLALALLPATSRVEAVPGLVDRAA